MAPKVNASEVPKADVGKEGEEWMGDVNAAEPKQCVFARLGRIAGDFVDLPFLHSEDAYE